MSHLVHPYFEFIGCMKFGITVTVTVSLEIHDRSPKIYMQKHVWTSLKTWKYLYIYIKDICSQQINVKYVVLKVFYIFGLWSPRYRKKVIQISHVVRAAVIPYTCGIFHWYLTSGSLNVKLDLLHFNDIHSWLSIHQGLIKRFELLKWFFSLNT